MARLVEQVRSEAQAEARAIVAEAELVAERTRAGALGEIELLRRQAAEERERALRDAIEQRASMRDEALLDAARIRDNAAHEVIGFVRRLDDERAQLVSNAHAEAERILEDARDEAST